MDHSSRTDSMILLYMTIGKGQKQKIGRTEMVADSLNPEYVTAISLDYFFEEQQTITVEVWDVDNAN